MKRARRTEEGGEGLTVSEQEHEVGVRLDGLSGLEDTSDKELLVENVLGQSGLDDVGSIWRGKKERRVNFRLRVSRS